MVGYLIGVLAARLATVLCALTIALPYLLRRNQLGLGVGLVEERATPYLRRLWPHFWSGYLIIALSFLHAGTVMAAMAHANELGILAATAAFFLLAFELVLGLILKDDQLTQRRLWRRIHFWTMAAFVAALAVHLGMNAL